MKSITVKAQKENRIYFRMLDCLYLNSYNNFEFPERKLNQSQKLTVYSSGAMQKFSIVQSQTPRMPKKIKTRPEEARSIKVWTNRSTTLRQNIS